jgi:hypothetical protein
MTTERKHWREIGRVKNSDWFKKLSPIEQRAVLDALEEQTHTSDTRVNRCSPWWSNSLLDFGTI